VSENVRGRMGTMNKKGDAAEKGGTQLIGKEEKE
jgi:hypothetical protein